MTTSWIVSAVRTPVGKLLGSLSGLSAPQLASIAIREAIARVPLDPARVDEVILGEVLQAGVGQAPARQAALAAGIPPSVPALTINKVCGSGLKAVMLADQAIRAGDAQIVVAGGMESMSRAPHLLPGSRAGTKFGNVQLLDSLLHDGLWCASENVAMGCLADATSMAEGISREAQDRFALESHQRACHAAAEGWFRNEIVPVAIGKQTFDRDEGPRSDSTYETLARLRPAFASTGTVTAGNSSQLSDGAAALVVAIESVAAKIDSPLKAKIIASATSGLAPKDLFLAPVYAVQQVLAKARLSLAEIDLVEMNEAFAAQCLACARRLGLSTDKLNIHGGAIALGHPIGASGARVLVTLLHALARRNLKHGLATLCLGGGNAVAMIVERVVEPDSTERNLP